MKNFTSGKSTVIGNIEKNTPFKKAKDFVGNYEYGQFYVLGFIKTHSDMYDKDQYSLYCLYQGEKFLMNVSNWYGIKLEEDFNNNNTTAEEYFKDACVKEIKEFKTKYNTNSINIIVYEN